MSGIDTKATKWYDNAWAALIFFTRLPFWRLHEPPRESYRAVVEWWPLVGWLTGGCMAATLWLVSMVMPWPVAVVAAMLVRVLLTGALHEDGLADFFDGFGGGGTERRLILTIMKDSRIGTYGVLALVFYELLLFFSLYSLSPTMAALTVLVADPYAKMVTAQLIMMMPYARTEEESKARTVYRKIEPRAGLGLAVMGLGPLAAYLYFFSAQLSWEVVVFVPCVVMYFLYRFIWRRLRGYTGDCCGAVFLLVELTFYLCVNALEG